MRIIHNLKKQNKLMKNRVLNTQKKLVVSRGEVVKSTLTMMMSTEQGMELLNHYIT